MSDQRIMQLAIDLAKGGLYTASPNPRVGCVMVRAGQIIGRGYHLRAGEGHSEVNAIADAGGADKVRGATAYVSLEPCSHSGKTGPCTEALIAAGVAKVVVAMVDPNPLVAGKGISQLRAAGIIVELGVLEQQAEALNRGFIKRMKTGLPWVRVKLAMSLDGRTAMASGESQWITGSAARSDVQRLRASSCAIVSGVDTVISDNASLTVRAKELGLEPELTTLAVERQPLRVIMDSQLRLSVTAKILSLPGTVKIITASDNAAAQQRLTNAGAELHYLPGDNVSQDHVRVDLHAAMALLGQCQCNEVMVEAGATLAGALLEAGLVDQLTVYMAPTLLGSEARPLLSLPLAAMAEQRRLVIDTITPVGGDWRIDARPA